MITSISNPKIQRVRDLLTHRKSREEGLSFVLEGVRLVEEANSSGWFVSQVFRTAQMSERGKSLVDQLARNGSMVDEIPVELLSRITNTEESQGILAVVDQKILPIKGPLDFVVIVDQLRDPGNLGTLLRTAAACGAQGVFLSPGTVDPFNPKVLRSGMGAHFRLPIRSLTWNEIDQICQERPQPLQLMAAEAEKGISCWEADLRQPIGLILGGEAEGVSDEAIQLVHDFIRIPMPGQSESLNAAVAAGILMFEVVRQRNYLTNSQHLV